MRLARALCPIALLLAAGVASAQVGNAITYQGRLTDNGQPANGVYDLSFVLYPTSNSIFSVGDPVNLQDVQVSGGLFTVKLDFGPVFDGNSKWVSMSVRPGANTGAYTALSPRQELTPAPHAITAASLSLPLADSGASDTGLFNEALFKIEQTGTAHAILGQATNGGSGVVGRAGTTGSGVAGYQGATSGFVSGVYGESASSSGRGVVGHAIAQGGSAAFGVYGVTESDTSGATGVRGVANGGGTALTYGLFGQSTSSGGAGAHGQGKLGVYGLATTGDVNAVGVLGITSQNDGVGVNGRVSAGDQSAAIYGQVTAGPGWAGFFEGSVMITGNMNAQGSKNFFIDNPENPTNEYLTHACVESDEMKNMYDGVATLGAAGSAVVQLPSWFDDLNANFRYQLTCIGGHAPVYVGSELANNAFTIAGGNPGLKVSWQVTGVRIDPAALAARFDVVSPKPEGERGRLLAPAAYGMDASMGVGRIANPRPTPPARPAPGQNVVLEATQAGQATR